MVLIFTGQNHPEISLRDGLKIGFSMALTFQDADPYMSIHKVWCFSQAASGKHTMCAPQQL